MSMVMICLKTIVIWGLLCLFATQPSTGQSPCGTWVLLSESCYLFSDFVATWGDAIAICNAFNAKLLSVETSDENFLLDGYLQTKHPHADNDKIAADYWTGGNDIEKEGSFKWLATDQHFVYTYWMIHQPDPAEQDCVEIRGVSNFKWHDDNCEHQHRFICEKPMTGSPGEIIG
ncbi:C-type lectin mosGCTL-1-like [Crassostrea virginica]